MKVLICLDFSKASDVILQEANEFVKKFPDVKIYVHTVKDIGAFSYDQGFADSAMEVLDKESDGVKKKAEAVFGIENITFSCGMGLPFESILDRAKELNCDLLILGTHGRTGLNHALMGSVAERILRKTEWSTLVIPVKTKM
jgi:nucleotide-binding universal stress UspA family protein